MIPEGGATIFGDAVLTFSFSSFLLLVGFTRLKLAFLATGFFIIFLFFITIIVLLKIITVTIIRYITNLFIVQLINNICGDFKVLKSIPELSSTLYNWKGKA